MGDYEHRQYGPWFVMLLVMGAGILAIAVWLAVSGRAAVEVALLMIAAGAVFLLAATLFVYLDVRDERDRLALRFGPMPLFGTSLPYEALESVEPARMGLLYGFGVQGLPGAFILFRIWGSDGVQVRLKRRRGLWRARTVIIGTDDAEHLLEFLQGKIGQHAPGA